MSDIFIPLLLLIIGFATGAFISNRFTSLKNKSKTGKLEADILNTGEQSIKLERQIQETLSNLEAMRTEKDSYKDELIKKTTEFNTLEKKLLDQEEKLRIQFFYGEDLIINLSFFCFVP
jgi:chromosome segregation ATPase